MLESSFYEDSMNSKYNLPVSQQSILDLKGTVHANWAKAKIHNSPRSFKETHTVHACVHDFSHRASSYVKMELQLKQHKFTDAESCTSQG